MQTHTASRLGVVRRCAGTTRRSCALAARAAPTVAAGSGFCTSVAKLRLLTRPCPGVRVGGSRRGVAAAASAAQADGLALPAAQSCTFRIGDSEIRLETGRVGRQAGGAIMATEGETVLYTTICASDEQPKDKSFLPLTVVYQERFSAAGRTASGFVKRDGKQRESEILVSRLVDRPLRPVFTVRPSILYSAPRMALSAWPRAAGRVLHRDAGAAACAVLGRRANARRTRHYSCRSCAGDFRHPLREAHRWGARRLAFDVARPGCQPHAGAGAASAKHAPVMRV